MVRNYYVSTICTKGHVLDAYQGDSQKHCSICGSTTISKCIECNSTLRGHERYDMPVVGKRDYKLPYYCYNCGKPYPWTRLILDSAVELLSLDENLDEETRKIISNSIPDLIVESPATPVAVARYKKYISSTQQFVRDGMKQLLVEVIAEALKKSIFQS